MEEGNYFVIDTREQWENAYATEYIQIDTDGIALSKSDDYVFLDVVPSATGAPFEKEALDPLKLFTKCLSLEGGLSIAFGVDDIYVVEALENSSQWVLFCLALINGQIRKEQEVNEGTMIAAKGEYGLYLLDSQSKKIFTVDSYWEWEPIEMVLLDENNIPYTFDQPLDIGSDEDDNLYLLEPEQQIILKFNSSGSLLQVIPIPYNQDVRFTSLSVTDSDNIYLGFLDQEDNYFFLHIGKSETYPIKGTYVSEVFDSNIEDCRWHRVVLDMELPANTQAIFSYVATNNLQSLNGTEHFNSNILENLNDALLFEATGRYLRFKITVFSDAGRQYTPLIHGVKLFYPRNTYLRYLPETYQEDPAGKDFTERFLALFERFMQHSEEQIYHFTDYLDTQNIPGDFLQWLAQWLAVSLDENWTQDQKRKLLAETPLLYKKRGTPTTMSRIIEIYYGLAPIIIEPFQLECAENLQYKKLLEQLFGTDPYQFSVLLKPQWEDPDSLEKTALVVDDNQRAAIQRIIDAEKPAFTTGMLHILEPGFYLDMHTYLEINTLMAKKEFLLGKTSVIGRDTYLYDTESSAQIERNSRIGIDFKLT